jgi:dUTP pyrophosphatase
VQWGRVLIPFKRLDPDAVLPTRAHPADAGLDLYTKVRLDLPRGRLLKFGLGLAVAIPPGRVGRIEVRSSLAAKGITVFGGTIDSGYAGEVSVVLKNASSSDHVIQARERVAQLLVLPVDVLEPEWVDDLPASDRGVGGFGSTGR